jgi:hypothetical protein
MNTARSPYAPQNKAVNRNPRKSGKIGRPKKNSAPQITVAEWLHRHNLQSPHNIPSLSLQKEFDRIFAGVKILWPQPGGQVHFQNCPADLCFYGGEAGAGKSWNLLFDHVKWVNFISALSLGVRIPRYSLQMAYGIKHCRFTHRSVVVLSNLRIRCSCFHLARKFILNILSTRKM